MVAEMCGDYFQRYRRQTHVTPKSYLSFISGYKAIYDAKRSEIGQLAQRMNTGLKKLIEATESVNELSKQLAVKEKELEVASRKADEVLAEVTASAQAAEVVKVQVQKVKDKAQKLVDEIAVSWLSCISQILSDCYHKYYFTFSGPSFKGPETWNCGTSLQQTAAWITSRFFILLKKYQTIAIMIFQHWSLIFIVIIIIIIEIIIYNEEIKLI